MVRLGEGGGGGSGGGGDGRRRLFLKSKIGGGGGGGPEGGRRGRAGTPPHPIPSLSADIPDVKPEFMEAAMNKQADNVML